MKHAVLPLALCLSSAFAQEATTLDTVVVTASSKAQSIRDVQAAVQVIDRTELQKYSGTSLTETLMLATGVDARPNGANSTVAIRGIITNAGSPVLLLVDGLRRTAKYGGTNLNLIAVEDVERIEIVRGPMSALYGADATGGVINVITKRPGAAGTGSLRASLGGMQGDQRDTITAGATLNLEAAGSAHRLSVEQRIRDPFRYDRNAYLADLGRIDQRFLSLTGEWALGDKQRFGYVLEHMNQLDTSPGLLAAAPPTRPQPVRFDGYEQERRNFLALRYGAELAGGDLSVDFSDGQSDGATTRAFPTIETTDYGQRQLQARYGWDWGDHRVTVGGGQTRDDLAISITSRRAERTNTHLLVQDEWTIGAGFRLLAGLRHDRFNDFGNVNTPRLALNWGHGPWSVRIAHGEAYRAPSVLEQYSSFLRGRFLIVGDPNLKPEQNKSNELALAWREKGRSVELTVFDADLRNLIQTITVPRQATDPASVTSRSQYANVARASLRGVELQGDWQLGAGFSAQWGLDWLDATDGSTGTRLTQRAKTISRLGLRWTDGAWTADARVRRYGSYWNADPAIRGSAPFASNYTVGDLRLERQWTSALSFALGVDNVNNARQPINWSNTGATMDPPARFVHVSGRYRF